MPGFAKPRFSYTIDTARERRNLRAHKARRGVPDRRPGHLLVAT